MYTMGSGTFRGNRYRAGTLRDGTIWFLRWPRPQGTQASDFSRLGKGSERGEGCTARWVGDFEFDSSDGRAEGRGALVGIFESDFSDYIVSSLGNCV